MKIGLIFLFLFIIGYASVPFETPQKMSHDTAVGQTKEAKVVSSDDYKGDIYGEVLGKTQTDLEQRRLDNFKGIWESQPPRKYCYVLTIEGDNSDLDGVPYRVFIEDGKIKQSEFVNESDQEKFENIDNYKILRIEDLFNKIQEELDKNPDKVKFIYNEAYGYPTTVYVDLSENENDEIGYYVSDFQIDDI